MTVKEFHDYLDGFIRLYPNLSDAPLVRPNGDYPGLGPQFIPLRGARPHDLDGTGKVMAVIDTHLADVGLFISVPTTGIFKEIAHVPIVEIR